MAWHQFNRDILNKKINQLNIKVELKIKVISHLPILFFWICPAPSRSPQKTSLEKKHSKAIIYCDEDCFVIPWLPRIIPEWDATPLLCWRLAHQTIKHTRRTLQMNVPPTSICTNYKFVCGNIMCPQCNTLDRKTNSLCQRSFFPSYILF